MSERIPTPPDRLDAAAREAARKAEIEKENPEPSLASRVGQIGVLGWMIVIPALLGVLLGHWIDSRTGGGIMATAALMLVGVSIGFWSAWQWMHRA